MQLLYVTSVDVLFCPETDTCLSYPCLHGGSCTDELDGYSCICLASYSGDHCQWRKCHIGSCHHCF